jgi:hypothetical protein
VPSLGFELVGHLLQVFEQALLSGFQTPNEVSILPYSCFFSFYEIKSFSGHR